MRTVDGPPQVVDLADLRRRRAEILEVVAAGVEPHGRRLSSGPATSSRSAAYHQAGHAVVAAVLGWAPVRVELFGEPHLSGVRGDAPTPEVLQVVLAGVEAQAGLSVLIEDEVDIDSIASCMTSPFVRAHIAFVDEGLLGRWLDRARLGASTLLANPVHWSAVRRMAAELQRRGSLTPARVRALVARD